MGRVSKRLLAIVSHFESPVAITARGVVGSAFDCHVAHGPPRCTSAWVGDRERGDPRAGVGADSPHWMGNRSKLLQVERQQSENQEVRGRVSQMGECERYPRGICGKELHGKPRRRTCGGGLPLLSLTGGQTSESRRTKLGDREKYVSESPWANQPVPCRKRETESGLATISSTTQVRPASCWQRAD